LVGKDKKKFYVHKAFACCYSYVLRTAFNGKYAEGETHIYTLKDTTLGAMKLFNVWLYRQKLPQFKLEVDQPSTTFYDNVVRLYLLGVEFRIPQLQNQAINALESCLEVSRTPPVNILKMAWEKSPRRKSHPEIPG